MSQQEGATAPMRAPWRLDRVDLLARAEREAAGFRAAAPFPHVVVDGFLPDDLLDAVVSTFPGPRDVAWRRYEARREVKLALEDETRMPAPAVEVLRELNGQVFVEYLEALTGITGLIPDPHFRGAGLHQILPGGLLKIHADFDSQLHLGLHRRLNALLYLNHDWDPAWGGDLELWDAAMTHPVRRVAPVANRLLIFETAGAHYHGHPEPLACPPGRSRRSLAWFFYTVPAAGHTPSYAQWQERPGEVLTTPAERLAAAAKAATPAPVKDLAKRLLGRRAAGGRRGPRPHDEGASTRTPGEPRPGRPG